MDNLLNTLDAWRDIIGSAQVITDEQMLLAAQTATFTTTQTIPAIIRPANRDEVQQCVKIANQYKIPLYPISCGKNWGYGSRVPVRDGCVIIELSRLNRIVDYNEKMAYVTVEPGVTFSQLFLFLEAQKSNLFMSVTGTTTDASLIGNVLERGIGKGPYGDRIGNVSGFEVVLPTGDCIHTGFGRFGNAKTTEVSRCGVGPYIDGIFTQSNLGIVTKMTLWLTPLPKHFQTFYYSIKKEEQLEPLIETLRELRLDGTIRTPFLIANDYRRLSLLQQYPWKEAQGQTPLAQDLMKRLKIARKLDSIWAGEGALYCSSKAQGLAQRELLEERLKDLVDHLFFIDEDNLRLAILLQLTSIGTTKLDLTTRIGTAYHRSGFIGFPRKRGLAMAYWRKSQPIPARPDLDKDRCGIVWLSPAVPFDGEQVRVVVNLIQETCLAYQFEPNIGLNCATDRSIDVTGAIIYDRATASEDERALKCYDEMLQKMTTAGYLPYRLGIHSMESLPPPIDDYGKFISTLKRALDPNDILAPGRYDFRKDWPASE
jgi:4-cresol dehydrogenase (hydroxylating) flavoprotein subunit